jgi:hypothetical protein
MPNLSQFYPTSVNQNNFVYTTGNQRISGLKDFALRPTVNGVPVVLYGEFCPEDNGGGGDGGTIENPQDVVYITGDQLIFGEKRFDNATNLEGARFLASGEGKYLEKYFYANLSSGNLEYSSPEHPNSIIFVNITESNIYSVYLPNTEYASEANYLKFVFESTPIPSGAFDQWYDSGDAEMLPASGSAGWNNYYASGLQINFYSNGIDASGNYSPAFELVSVFPVIDDSISFLFRDGNWVIADEKRNNEIPYHTHYIDDIIGFSGIDGNYIHLEKVYNHTFEDGLNILYTAPQERNSYINLTFNTSSPCYVDLAHPTGDVANGDRIILNVKTIVEQPERLIVRHTPFNDSGNYLSYTNLYNLPVPNLNDALEFWFQDPEWTLKASPGGNNIGGSGFGGGAGGSGCCSTIPFAGNRAVKRTSWPVNFNPQTNDVVTFLNKVFYPFTSATISLNSYNLKELGTTFSNVPFVGQIVQNDEVPNGISFLQFLRNGTPIHTITSPAFGSFNYQSIISINNTSILAAKVNINNDGDPTMIISSQTVEFEAPMYYGAGNADLTESQIKLVLTKELERKTNKTRSFNANNQKLYIVVPIGWGLFTSIRDANNFENIAGWSFRIQEFTLADGITKQNYYIWETNNLVFDVNNYSLTFNF